MRQVYSVPLSVLIGALGGEITALVLGWIASPSTPGVVQGTTWPPGIPVSFLAFYIGVPLSAAGSGVLAYGGFVRGRALVGSILGVCAGVALGGLLALDSTQIGRWWLSSLPGDGVLASLLFGFTTAFLFALAVCLTLDASWETSAVWRGRAAQLVALGAMAGFVIGGLAGSAAGALTVANHECAPGYVSGACVGGSGYAALGVPGFLVGSWGGSLAGATAGGDVSAVGRLLRQSQARSVREQSPSQF